MEYYKTLVLSGNSTDGVITLGAVQYLYDSGKLDNIENYVGTSSGSIINSLLCVGYSPLEILEYLCTNAVFQQVGCMNIAKLVLEGEGLYDFETIKKPLRDMIIRKVGFIPTMNELWNVSRKNFVCVTINDTIQKRIYVSRENFPDILITDAVHMSSCFPIIFKPFLYKNENYFDGGIGDNFPVKFSTKFAGSGICLCVSPQQYNFENIPQIIRSVLRLVSLHNNLVAEDQNIYTDRHCIYIKNIVPSFFDFSSSPLKLVKMFYDGYDELEKLITIQ